MGRGADDVKAEGGADAVHAALNGARPVLRALPTEGAALLCAAAEAQVVPDATAPVAPRLFDAERFEAVTLAALAAPIPPKLRFGLAPLDERTDGGHPAGGMGILGAPPKSHKTAWLTHQSMVWAGQGERIVYISTELTRREVAARMSSWAQFGASNKWHGRIKYETAQAAANYEPIKWLADRVEVVSLVDEPERWPGILDECRSLTPAPMVIADYIEELADRLPDAGSTEAERNKATLRMLQRYAAETQGRVLAVCSVSNHVQMGREAVFARQDALPEEFAAAAVKHTGFGSYAASYILALQKPANEADAKIVDPKTGHPCLPMKLHLAITREGTGPVTVPVLSFAGYCRFALDGRAPEDRVNPLWALIERELAKPVHRLGKSGKDIARLVRSGQGATNEALKELLAMGKVWASCEPGRGKRPSWRHLMYAPTQTECVQTTIKE